MTTSNFEKYEKALQNQLITVSIWLIVNIFLFSIYAHKTMKLKERDFHLIMIIMFIGCFVCVFNSILLANIALKNQKNYYETADEFQMTKYWIATFLFFVIAYTIFII